MLPGTSRSAGGNSDYALAAALTVVAVAGVAAVAIVDVGLALGKSIRIARLARDVAAGLPRESMLVLVVARLAVAVGVYTLRHRADLVAWGRAALRTSWGRLLLLGASILVLTAVFERSLNRMVGAGLPRPLLEESFELLAALYCLLALVLRPREPGTPGRRARPPRGSA
jgi:hypothetical protein